MDVHRELETLRAYFDSQHLGLVESDQPGIGSPVKPYR